MTAALRPSPRRRGRWFRLRGRTESEMLCFDIGGAHAGSIIRWHSATFWRAWVRGQPQAEFRQRWRAKLHVEALARTLFGAEKIPGSSLR